MKSALAAMVLLGAACSAAAPTDPTTPVTTPTEAPFEAPTAGSEPGGATAPADGASPAVPSSGASEEGTKVAGQSSCDDLAKVCHDHAAASPLVAECHKVGHAGDAAVCDKRHHECKAACEKAAKGGAHPDHGGGKHH